METNNSVCECDQYVEHLSLLSAQGNLVVTTEDVYNERGTLLLRAGTPISHRSTAMLRNHRMSKPFDDVVAVERVLSVTDLLQRFDALVAEEDDLRRVAENFQGDDLLRHVCHTADLGPAMLQRLTVLEQALPRVFHRALFAAWLATLAAHLQKRDQEELRLSLLAGLSHDFGLLHIDPALADKKRNIEADEWRAIQRHVSISALLVESMQRYPARLAKIVRQHHERCDGAGYPAGLSTDALDPLSQLLALADMIHALRFRKSIANDVSLQDCLAFLRVNTRTFGEDNYHAVARVLVSAGGTNTDAERNVDPSRAQLMDVNREFAQLFQDLEAMRASVERREVSRTAQSLLNLVQQIRWVSLSSGLGGEVYAMLLQQQASESRGDVHEIVVTMREVMWLVRRIVRQLEDHLAEELDAELRAELAAVAERIGERLERCWSILEPPEKGATLAP